MEEPILNAHNKAEFEPAHSVDSGTRQTFMENKTKHNRILELDLLKSFTIIVSMIGIHCMYDLTSLSVADGPLEAVLNIISSPFTAPVFIFCMGMTSVFSHHRESGDYFRRGIRLITYGMVLYNKYFKARLNAFFGLHPSAWILGIWLASILFGIWYFSTIPGPYTMPY